MNFKIIFWSFSRKNWQKTTKKNGNFQVKEDRCYKNPQSSIYSILTTHISFFGLIICPLPTANITCFGSLIFHSYFLLLFARISAKFSYGATLSAQMS
jgi:hypothetical protein